MKEIWEFSRHLSLLTLIYRERKQEREREREGERTEEKDPNTEVKDIEQIKMEDSYFSK